MAIEGNLYVTNVEKEGPYLKIWGQIERNVPIGIEKTLAVIKPQFDIGQHLPSMPEFSCGKVMCARFKDGNYYRAKVTNLNFLQQGVVEVQFIDYGNKEFVQSIHTRTLNSPLTSHIADIPPQAKEFILGNITHPGLNWEEAFFQIITNTLRYIEFPYQTMYKIGSFTVIRLYKNGNEDVATLLINSGYGIPVASELQQMTLCSNRSPPGLPIGAAAIPPNIFIPQGTTKSSPPSLSSPTTPTILKFKATPLESGSEHPCYVSYISDGPGLFSIQLQKQEETLKRMMTEINNMSLQYLDEDPIPGTVCLAKAVDDNYVCRAVVMNMVDNKFKVFYVDFGNTEEVSLDRLYQIPFKFVIPKVMAVRFALSGLQNMFISIEMKCAFKNFVNNKLMYMRVIPMKVRPPLPLCELWDEKGNNVLDILKEVALESYPECLPLTRGNVEVKVSFVYSCNRFYVQLKSKEEDLRQLMESLQNKFSKLVRFSKDSIKSGKTCIALYEDNQWYRAQILDSEGEQIRVKYVDYGNEELVSLENLRVPESEDIIKLRPQALECALNGYQNMEPDAQRDSLLEEIILEKDFVMKVVEVPDYRAIVDLVDVEQNNVTSLLFAKIAAANSQLSPPSTHDNNKFESKKKGSFSQFNEQKSRKSSISSRDSIENDFGKRSPNPNESWRQNNRSYRDSNENNDTRNKKQDSWRQNKSQRNGMEENTNRWNKKNDFGRNSFDKDNSPEFNQNRGFRNDEKGQGDRQRNFGDKGGFKNKGEKKFGDRSEKFGDRSEKFDDKPDRFGDRPDRFGDRPDRFGDRPDRFKDRNDKFGAGDRPNFNRSSSKEGRSPRNKPFTDFNSMDNNESWDASPVKSPPPTVSEPILDIAGPDAYFAVDNLNDLSEKVRICWFHNPSHFYIQRQTTEADFKSMMTDIQSTYKNVQPCSNVTPGMAVVALFPEDKVLYRAVVLEVVLSEFLVVFIDFGNRAKVRKVWSIDKKFMNLPRQAHCCGLSGVMPIGETWQDAEKYGTLFDRDSFDIKFYANPYDPDFYDVELSHDGIEVAQELLDGGLAKKAEVYEGADIYVDVPLLQQQQIRVTLQDVPSLDNFSVILDNGYTLNCTLHNLSDAVEQHIEVLQQWIGAQLIMFVDNVLEDNRLEVTFYDHEGYKLDIIQPDENAFDSVDPLCPMPVYANKITGFITHASENKLYITPNEYSQYLEGLVEQLFTTYDTSTNENPIIPDNDDIIAAKSSDGQWYRGRVEEVDEKNVTVLFIDYGNSEKVSLDNLRPLSNEFKEFPILSLDVLTKTSCSHLVDQEVTLEIQFVESGWEAVTVEPISQTAPENLENNVSNEEAASLEVAPQQSANQKGVRVILSHTDSPSDFYLQVFDATEEIDSLQDLLQKEVDNFPVLENPTAGVLCAAPYSVNQEWYRAQVLDADEDITTVRYVDFGNTDVIANATASIKTLPSELLALAHHARRCSLMYKYLEKDWSPVAYERFEELTNSDDLSAEIVHQDEKLTYVELFASGINIGEVLMNEGLALKLKLDADAGCMGYVSHFNSPSEFWIQLEHSVGDLEWVAEQLEGAENYPELSDLTPGSLCAAIFSEDEQWYRARILSNTVAGLEVLFIDYGNSYTCNSVRELPEELILLQPLAVKCSLQKPEGMLQWSPAAAEKFKEISQDGAAEFVVRKITPGETSIVQLMLDGKDISEQLKPDKVDGYISFFESIDNFWIQKSSFYNDIENLAASMVEASNWPQLTSVNVDDILAGFYVEDECWYRVKITSIKDEEYTVLFIDYGNTAVIHEVRELIEEVKHQTPYATQCKLDSLPGYKWPDDINKNLEAINNEGATEFQIEFVSDKIVRLYLNNRDIRADLGCVKCSPLASLQSSPIKAQRVLDNTEDILENDSENILVVEGVVSEIEERVIDKIGELNLSEDIRKECQDIVQEISDACTAEETESDSTIKKSESEHTDSSSTVSQETEQTSTPSKGDSQSTHSSPSLSSNVSNVDVSTTSTDIENDIEEQKLEDSFSSGDALVKDCQDIVTDIVDNIGSPKEKRAQETNVESKEENEQKNGESLKDSSNTSSDSSNTPSDSSNTSSPTNSPAKLNHEIEETTESDIIKEAKESLDRAVDNAMDTSEMTKKGEGEPVTRLVNEDDEMVQS